MSSILEIAVGTLWTDEHARMLQEILDTSSARGAYCMALATVHIANNLGTLPPRSVLIEASQCESIQSAFELGERYIEGVRKSTRKGESMPRKKGQKNTAGQAQQRSASNGGGTSGPSIKPAQLKKFENQLGQLMKIGTNLQEFARQLGGSAQAAGNTQQKSSARGGKKQAAAGAQA